MRTLTICPSIRIGKYEEFGKLCHDCNRRLPTLNRTEWITKATLYNDRKINENTVCMSINISKEVRNNDGKFQIN